MYIDTDNTFAAQVEITNGTTQQTLSHNHPNPITMTGTILWLMTTLVFKDDSGYSQITLYINQSSDLSLQQSGYTYITEADPVSLVVGGPGSFTGFVYYFALTDYMSGTITISCSSCSSSHLDGRCYPSGGDCKSLCTDPNFAINCTTDCGSCVTGVCQDDGTCLQCNPNSCADEYSCGIEDPNNCSACKDPFASLSSTPLGTCTCNAGYHNTATGNDVICALDCPSNCTTCTGTPGSVTCTVCDDQYYLDANGDCTACYAPCNKCSGTTGSTCIDCLDANATPNGSGVCICNDYYYDNDPDANLVDCQPCGLTNCIQCQKPSATIECLECVSPDYLDSSTKQCVNDCGIGYWEEDSPQRLCQSCDSNCYTCDLSATNCTGCNDTYQLQTNTCVCPSNSTENVSICECNPGYYDNDGTNAVLDCQPCTAPCKNCNSSGTDCSSCVDTYELSTNTCGCPSDSNEQSGKCECDVGFYDADPTSQILDCQACPGGVCSCNYSFYMDDSQNCQPCDPNCEECDGSATNCTNCPASYYLASNNTCVQTCPNGFWSKIAARNYCAVCQLPCLQCKNAVTEQRCLTCDSDRKQVIDGKCFCKTPFEESSGGTCVCPLNSQEALNSCECKDGFYDSDPSEQLVCEKCPEICISDKCYLQGDEVLCECQEGLYKQPDSDQCLSTCPDRYWKNFETHKCVLCTPPCSSCQDGVEKQCIDCVDPNASPPQCVCNQPFNLRGGICVCPDNSQEIQGNCECLTGYYNSSSDRIQCDKCSKGCIKCNNRGCSECENGYVLQTDLTCRVVQQDDIKLTISSIVSNQITFEIINYSIQYSDLNIQLKIGGIEVTDFIIQQQGDSFVIVVNDKKFQQIQETVQISTIIPEYSQLIDGSMTVQAPEVTSLTAEEEEAKQLNQVASTGSQASVGGSAAFSTFTGSFGALWALVNTIQITAFIPLTNIDLPLPLVEFFAGLSEYNIAPNVFEYVMVEQTGPRDSLKARNGIETMDFLMNCGDLLTIFLIQILLLPAYILIMQIPWKRMQEFIMRIVRSYRWNVFIRFWLESYLEIGLAGYVQLYSLSANDMSSCVNSFLAVVSVVSFNQILTIVTPISLLLLFKRKIKTFVSENNTEGLRNWETLLYEFTEEGTDVKRWFYFYFILRRLIYILNQLYLYNFPAAQVLINISHTLLVTSKQNFLFIVLYRPYVDKITNILMIINEFGISLIFILCGIFYFDLSNDIRDFLKDSVLIITYIILGLQFLNILITSVVAIVKTIRKLRELKLQQKQKQEQSLKQINLNGSSLFLDGPETAALPKSYTMQDSPKMKTCSFPKVVPEQKRHNSVFTDFQQPDIEPEADLFYVRHLQPNIEEIVQEEDPVDDHASFVMTPSPFIKRSTFR